MKLMFIRHAEPDYAHDSLTKKGRREAELLSKRICQLPNIKAFYVSPLGRAQETARYTLEKLDRHAEVMPWLREFGGLIIDPETGKNRLCWDLRPRIWQPRNALHGADTWLDDPMMQSVNAPQVWQDVTAGLDELLAHHGYTRGEGTIYHCEDNRPDTLVFFCHFGITVACLAHLLGISPMVLWHCFSCQPSSVTTLITEERTKGEVVFRCMQLGDLGHLYAGNEPYSTAALFAECFDGRDSTNPIEWESPDWEG